MKRKQFMQLIFGSALIGFLPKRRSPEEKPPTKEVNVINEHTSNDPIEFRINGKDLVGILKKDEKNRI